ncbi:hypothetical protein OVS_01825 [Mycoplasma ovis str. Michigan]|uniref:Uncharacterized protein n=1 Tax=Mycoplasma ovis str. Michigan TaxID=1415773 RepID=A0ABN4BLR2_9MOLU|nr:hypothetical protein [Mycoplasma ovis]AHC40250.1 hypothetical protein OVS_01825 [Mycoplasma ovis str. Michigan]
MSSLNPEPIKLPSIQNIYQEIDKEGSIDELEKKVNFEYPQLSWKYLPFDSSGRKSLLDNFKSAKAKVNKWNQLQSQRKNGSDVGSFFSDDALDKHERLSIEKFFCFQNDLKDLRVRLTKELKEIGRIDLEATTLSEKKICQDFKKSLSQIHWTKERVKIKNFPRGSQGFSNDSGWGDWQKSNPYRHFYNSENEFAEAIVLLQAKQVWIDSQKRTLVASKEMIPSIPRAQQHFRRQEGRLKTLESRTSSHIEMKVASKLLSMID